MSILNKVADFFGFVSHDNEGVTMMNEHDVPTSDGQMPEKVQQPVSGDEMPVAGSGDEPAGGDEPQPDIVMPEQSPQSEQPLRPEQPSQPEE